MLSIALTKGRLEKQSVAMFEQCGYGIDDLKNKGRQLVFLDTEKEQRYFLVKAADCVTYVEHGVADVGFVGKDTLMESEGRYYELMDLGIEERFAEVVFYTESWGPQYRGREAVRHWFEEWNTRGRVLVWDIRQFFHKEGQTVVEWYFRNAMQDGGVEEFDGVSRIEWTPEGKIAALKEFGCNSHTYDPYRSGPEPVFRDEAARWF